MSLAKYLAKAAAEAPKALEFAKANKGLLAGVGAGGVALAAAPHVQHSYDDFMTDQAIKSMKRNAKRAAVDTMEFAGKHPLVAAGALGGAGLAGYGMQPDGMGQLAQQAPGIIDAVLRARLEYQHRGQQK